MQNIRVRAGRRAYRADPRRRFQPGPYRTYFGPGGRPRWLATSGFDLTLLKEAALGRRFPVWPWSAPPRGPGALRLGCSPARRRATLPFAKPTSRRRTVAKTPPQRSSSPWSALSTAILRMTPFPFVLAHKQFRLAVLTSRDEDPVRLGTAVAPETGFITCFLVNALHPALMHRLAERVVFYYGAQTSRFLPAQRVPRPLHPLSETNFKSAVIASGAIPIVVGGVRDIFGAPDGIYRDGGFLDYHINQDYTTRNDGLDPFFSSSGANHPRLDGQETQETAAAGELS